MSVFCVLFIFYFFRLLFVWLCLCARAPHAPQQFFFTDSRADRPAAAPTTEQNKHRYKALSRAPVVRKLPGTLLSLTKRYLQATPVRVVFLGGRSCFQSVWKGRRGRAAASSGERRPEMLHTRFLSFNTPPPPRKINAHAQINNYTGGGRVVVRPARQGRLKKKKQKNLFFLGSRLVAAKTLATKICCL